MQQTGFLQIMETVVTGSIPEVDLDFFPNFSLHTEFSTSVEDKFELAVKIMAVPGIELVTFVTSV